jgi:FkbM family methyltransferase
VKGVAFRLLGERGFERLRAPYMALKIRSGRYRDDEVDLLAHAVAPGDTVVDVGANFGLYAFHAARAAGASGHVYAFEALPTTALALRRVLRLLRVADSVTVVDKAAGDFAGSAPIAVPRRDDGSVQRGVATLAPRADAAAAETVDVPVARIDDELPGGREIAFMKVDVEGADLAALRGAERTIAESAPTILVEVAPRLLARQGDSAAAVEAFLERHGYRTYRYDAAARRLVACHASEATFNVLAVHPRRAQRVATLF